MVFFITYLWKADRLLEGEGVLSESEFAGRLLAVVCENGVLCVPMKNGCAERGLCVCWQKVIGHLGLVILLF